MSNADAPAHPVTFEHDGATSEAPGLTKREHFAALAMQGLLSAQATEPAEYQCVIEGLAMEAVSYADALLAALENGE